MKILKNEKIQIWKIESEIRRIFDVSAGSLYDGTDTDKAKYYDDSSSNVSWLSLNSEFDKDLAKVSDKQQITYLCFETNLQLDRHYV